MSQISRRVRFAKPHRAAVRRCGLEIHDLQLALVVRMHIGLPKVSNLSIRHARRVDLRQG